MKCASLARFIRWLNGSLPFFETKAVVHVALT